MTEQMNVQNVRRLIEPVFASMLSETELRTLTFRVVSVTDGPEGGELPDDAVIRTNDAWVRWQVRGEDGESRSLPLDVD